MMADIKNILFRVVGVFLKQGVNIVLFFVAASILSPQDFGIYNYVLAFALALATIADFGVSPAVSKFVAKNQVSHSREKSGLVGSPLVVIFCVSTILSFILWLVHPLFNIDYEYFIYLALLIYVVPIFAVLDGVFRGIQDSRALFYAASAGAILSLVSCSYLINSFGISGILISQIIFYVTGIAVFLLSIKFNIFEFSRSTAMDILKLSVPLGLIGLVYLAYGRIDILILGSLGYTVDVGYYELVNKVILLISLPIQIFAQVKSPQIVTLWHTSKETVYPLACEYLAFSIPILMLLASSAYFVVPFLLQVYLKEFVNETVLMMLGIMLLAYVFQATSDLIGNIFTISTDHEHMNLYVMTFFALVNLILVFFGIKYFGLTGLVYAKLIVFVTYTITFLTIYFRALRRISPMINVNTSEPIS